MFSSQGWMDVRMEDIATRAGVSAATAYNHFPSKQALVGQVFAPLLARPFAQARRDIAAGRPAVEALADQVRALTEIVFRHRRLAAALWAAVQDYTIRVAGPARPDDELDPLVQAPLAESIRMLVDHGQRTGQLRTYPPAADLSRLVVALLLIRCVDIAQRTPAATIELLLTVLMGTLRPDLLAAAGPDSRPYAPAGEASRAP